VGSLAAATVLAATGILALFIDPISVHADGAGPLSSVGTPGYEALAVPQTGADSFSYGLPLCVADPDTPAMIVSVAPAASVGSGFRTLATLVREFVPTDADTPIIGVERFPPPHEYVPHPLAQATGFVVRTSCENGPREPYTELLVGLGIDGTDGGGWRGIEIEYKANGRRWTLRLDHDLLICGPSVARECNPSGLSQ
jgi:hypothetical protein